MVLIVTDQNDISSNHVIDWLINFDIPFIRVNEDDRISISSIRIDKQRQNDDFHIVINDRQSVKLSEITGYWYRRGAITFKLKQFRESDILGKEFAPMLKSDAKDMVGFLHFLLRSQEKLNFIGSFLDNFTSKLNNIFIARKCGLTIPESYVIDNRVDLKSILQNKKELITKSTGQIGRSINNYEQNYSIAGYSSLITLKNLSNIPEKFFPSLVQEKIEKKIELRVFYLNNECFTSAIFSQNDKQTEIDFRRYNKEKPNRVVPFKLPLHIEKGIVVLMNELQMNCGSLDFILTKSLEYVFLEVNPVGQFHQVSYPCNYFLERKIAKTLITR